MMAIKSTTIAVLSNGTLITLADKHLSAPAHIRAKIKDAELLALPIRMGVHVPPVVPDSQSDNPVERLAALYAPQPQRTTILEVPVEVKEWFDSHIPDE